LKAVDLLTINNENRLQKKVEVLEKKQDDIEMIKATALSKEKRIDELEKQMQAFMLIARDKLNIRDKMIKSLQDKQPKPTKEEVREMLKEGGFKKYLVAFDNKKEIKD
jgi:LPS O-antigen subunit length determinant protein (WzzB/FepE family)